MGLRQFTNSLSIIRRSEHTSRAYAAWRHLCWQGRKLAFPRPVSLRLSSSVITDNEAGGVISMVNMLGMYDFNNMNFVRRVLRGGRAFVDVGANIGAYSLVASENPDVFVVALEPNPTSYRKLLANLALNGRHNVKALNVGASATLGRMYMTDLPDTELNRIVDAPGATERTITVDVTTIDQICSDLHIRPALVKLDIEGHEPAALAGALACLRTVDAVLVEDGHRAAVVDLLGDQGLRGPFYYRHRAARLDRAPQRLMEDAVFIGASFAQRFPEIAVA